MNGISGAMSLKRLLKQMPALLTVVLLMAAGVLTLCFPKIYYQQETEWQFTTEKETWHSGRSLWPDVEPGQQDIVCRNRTFFVGGGDGHGR